MKIQIEHRILNKTLFEHDQENNTVKITLEIAISKKANLCEANLREADLYGADLYGADLYGADLYRADLYGADLRGANLRGADLYGADLYGADLYRADLYGADLEVKTPPIDDHYFISEILFRKAKTEQQKDFASRIRMELPQCWKYFVILAKKKKIYKWSKEILSQWKEFKETIQKYEKEK